MTRDASLTRQPAEDPFFVGFGVSVYQSSGGENTNWSAWEARRRLIGPTIAEGQKCGIASDFWNRYNEDIERAASLGSNCFRFTFEWGRLQPDGPGTKLNAEAVRRYGEILDSLDRRSLAPFATLHQFVHPLWFERLGAFKKQENIAIYVDYAARVFDAFGRRVRFWATFNEPGVASSAGHLYGVHPPGKLGRIRQHGRCQLNMLRAHTQAYDAIKAMPGGDKTSVGIVHNWFTFEPQRGGCCTPFYMRWLADLCNRMWGNDVVLRYLKTGVYDYNPLCVAGTYYKDPRGRPGCDHFGINYYSRGVFDWKLSATCNPGEIMTEMPYALWADGLLLAVRGVSTLGIPMYITETGVAEAGDRVRPIMIHMYMEKVEEAVRLGFDLRGIMYWTLVDNFEWADGFTMKFGVYKWSPDGTQQRTMRPSGALLKRWFERLRETCPKLRAVWLSDRNSVDGNGVDAEEPVQPADSALLLSK